jgi:phosphoribosylformylglycinamidine cyclo-ligase
MDYRAAGVDVEAGRQFVGQIKDMVGQTARPEVLGGLGGFSGLFRLPKGLQDPVLVSGTDGVGTKLKLAQEMEFHQTVGIDLVAMCVNDVLTCGAEPLFFLDYVATGKLEPQQLAQVVSGIAEGCKQAGCALLGGETAEMPGFYQPQEYDLAGFCVGIVEESLLLNGSQVQIGDVAIGLASRGVHSNGFSLVRKIVRDRQFQWSDRPESLGGKTLGDVLLTPTQIYVHPVLTALKIGLPIHGMAHITGGGLPENLPRGLGNGQSVKVDPTLWPTLPIFEWLAAQGNVHPYDMYDTFNMGIGFVVFVPTTEVQQAIAVFADHNIAAYQIGTVIEGAREVVGLPNK